MPDNQKIAQWAISVTNGLSAFQAFLASPKHTTLCFDAFKWHTNNKLCQNESGRCDGVLKYDYSRWQIESVSASLASSNIRTSYNGLRKILNFESSHSTRKNQADELQQTWGWLPDLVIKKNPRKIHKNCRK